MVRYLPRHVAVAVERVGDEVEGPQGDQAIEGSGCDAADLVRVEWQGLEVDEAVEKFLVHVGDRVLGKGSGIELILLGQASFKGSSWLDYCVAKLETFLVFYNSSRDCKLF